MVTMVVVGSRLTISSVLTWSESNSFCVYSSLRSCSKRSWSFMYDVFDDKQCKSLCSWDMYKRWKRCSSSFLVQGLWHFRLFLGAFKLQRFQERRNSLSLSFNDNGFGCYFRQSCLSLSYFADSGRHRLCIVSLLTILKLASLLWNRTVS